MQDAKVIARVRRMYRLLAPEMDERRRRQWAAAEARELGYGGITAVARATGLSRPTITAGMRELELPAKTRARAAERIRRPGGGRPRLVHVDPDILAALESLVEPVTRGDPESPLRWTCKSTANLAEELTRQNHPVSDRTVAALLKEAGYDTVQFAVASIRRWWIKMGQARFPSARKLMITADGGGSNSSRSRLWKVTLQDLADDLELALHVCHFPPGTSKWNKIEHRLFSFITQNWRGKPLVSHQTIVNLIAATTTRAGLVVKAALDKTHYDTQIKVSDAEIAALNLKRHDLHGDWNYTISPRRRKL